MKYVGAFTAGAGVTGLIFGQPVVAAGLFIMSGLYAVAYAIQSQVN